MKKLAKIAYLTRKLCQRNCIIDFYTTELRNFSSVNAEYSVFPETKKAPNRPKAAGPGSVYDVRALEPEGKTTGNLKSGKI